jgi:hypothetical protein
MYGANAALRDPQRLKNSSLWDFKNVSVCGAGSVIEHGDRGVIGALSVTRILLANSKSSNFNDFQSGHPGGATK